MKTKQIKIEPADLRAFKELIAPAIQTGAPTHLLQYRATVDLLSWFRTLPNANNYQDQVLQMDLQALVFQNITEVSTLGLTLDDNDIPHIMDSEPDLVHFGITFKTQWLPNSLNPHTAKGLKKLFAMLITIMLSDCTDCCNALTILNISSAGVYAYGDVSMTYHS